MATTGAEALLSVTGYYNRPNRRGIVRHYEEVARAAGGTRVIVYNIPSRTTVNLGPDLLAELAQIDGIAAVKQSNGAELRPIDGMTPADRQRRGTGALPRRGRRRRHPRAAGHIVGNEMRRDWGTEPSRRAEIHAQLSPLFGARYDLPRFAEGAFVEEEVPNSVPKGVDAFVFNARRPVFKDRRVREALAALFDFEWANRNLYFGLYARTCSFFEGSELSSCGRPADVEERALLAAFPDAVTADVLEGRGSPSVPTARAATARWPGRSRRS